MEVCVGKILTISELNVQILLNGEKVKYHDILFTNLKGKEVLFEVTEEDGHIVSTVPFQSYESERLQTSVHMERVC